MTQYQKQFLGQHIHMAAPIKFNNNENPEDLIAETRVYRGLGLQIKSKLACNQPSTYFANLHLGNI